MVDLEKLDLEDELGQFTFDAYCNQVYEALQIDSPKWAESLVATP